MSAAAQRGAVPLPGLRGRACGCQAGGFQQGQTRQLARRAGVGQIEQPEFVRRDLDRLGAAAAPFPKIEGTTVCLEPFPAVVVGNLKSLCRDFVVIGTEHQALRWVGGDIHLFIHEALGRPAVVREGVLSVRNGNRSKALHVERLADVGRIGRLPPNDQSQHAQKSQGRPDDPATEQRPPRASAKIGRLSFARHALLITPD